MMHRKGSKWICVFCLLCLVGWAGSVWAVYIDDARTLEVIGKAQTRTSIRLQHSDGFTHPHDIAAGNLVQWRNLAMIEAFWVPGNWDVRVAPYAPAGSAYAAPIPDTGMAKYLVTPDKKMSNSRWGVRVMGVLGNSLNLSVAHYKTFLDMPSVMFLHEPFRFNIQYSGVYGAFTNFGAFRDRDQISFMFTYLLN